LASLTTLIDAGYISLMHNCQIWHGQLCGGLALESGTAFCACLHCTALAHCWLLIFSAIFYISGYHCRVWWTKWTSVLIPFYSICYF